MSRSVFSGPWKEPEFDPAQFDPTLGLLDVQLEEIVEEVTVPHFPVGPEGVPVAQLHEAVNNPELAIEARKRVEQAYNDTPPNFTNVV